MEHVPPLLTWRDVRLQPVQAQYVELLSTALAELILRARALNRVKAERLRESIAEASALSLHRVLTAPETSFRLLSTGREDPDEVCTFLLDALAVESAHEAGYQTTGSWSALGDLRDSDSDVSRNAQHELLRLDLGSPHNHKLDLFGYVGDGIKSRPDLSSAEMCTVRRRISAASELIHAVSPPAAFFVHSFTRVVVVMKTAASSPRRYDDVRVLESGSNSHYIGRVLLVDAHRPGISVVDIADALVHESIHCLLYQEELFQPWFNKRTLYSDDLLVRSPWSGRAIPLRALLQAAFVWYGLFHFWEAAINAGVPPASVAVERRDIALRGFLGNALEQRIRPWWPDIPEPLLRAIQGMQDELRRYQ